MLLMAIFANGQIIAPIYDFKSNISKYIRMLEQGAQKRKGRKRGPALNLNQSVFSATRGRELFSRPSRRRIFPPALFFPFPAGRPGRNRRPGWAGAV